jgi:hypothetical protein
LYITKNAVNPKRVSWLQLISAGDENVVGQADTFPAALPKFESCQNDLRIGLILEFPHNRENNREFFGNFTRFQPPWSVLGSQPPSGFNSLQPIRCSIRKQGNFSPEQGIHPSEQGIHARHGRACPP